MRTTLCTAAATLSALLLAGCAAQPDEVKALLAPPTAQRQTGLTDGLWYWTLPDTPDGTVPKQGWSGAGAGPHGEIYVAGMDHTANAALYRLEPEGRGSEQPGATLRYVGDARTAAEAAGNRRPNDRFEKFHTQPTFLNGRIYVATMDYSYLDKGHADVRGLHWFAYDRVAARFQDLSASEPGGVGAAALGLPGMAADPTQGVLYGVATPTGELLRYDPARRVTTHLGRPDYGRPYVYPGRALWVGRTGRVYFTAGNPATNPRAGGPYDPAAFGHVRYWDPRTESFGEEVTWGLHDTRAIDYARCFDAPAPRTCYLMDNVGHIYRYSESPGLPGWTEIGDIGQAQGEFYGLTWVFQVRADASGADRAFIVARRGAVLAMDLRNGKATLLGNLWELEPVLNGQDFFGNSAWDRQGRFYFTAFPKQLTDAGRTKLVAIDPVRFTAAVARRHAPAPIRHDWQQRGRGINVAGRS